MLYIKNVALFFLSPFIALAYLFALPVVGFWMTGKFIFTRVRG